MKRTVHLLVLTALSTSIASADFLIGSVSTTGGSPVAGANIDIFESASGDELALSGDFTAIDGTFAIQIPAGTYDIVVHPPAPPTTTLVGTRYDSVPVSGTTNIGTVVVADGVALSGRVLRPGATPAVGVEIRIRDESTRDDVVLSVDNTEADGTFVTSVPTGTLRLSLDPGLDLPLAAPERQFLEINATTALGDILLDPGFFVTVDVVNSGGAPVVGADVDVVDLSTRTELFTTDDDTDGTGRADFVVPAGNFELEVCAPTAMRLAPQIVGPLAVNGPTNAGMVTLPPGRHMSGVVRSAQGAFAEGVDIDLFVAGTTTKVLTCDDDTDFLGQYLTTVPLGTFDVLFEAVNDDCPEAILIENVVVSNDLTLDANLTQSGLGCRYCLPGVTNNSGSPSWLDASGSASIAQNNVTLMATDVPANVFGFFLASRTQGEIAQPGTSSGVLCVVGSIGRYVGPGQVVMSGATGTLTLGIDPTLIPHPSLGFVSAAPGETWNFQAWYRDVTAQGASNFSTGLAITFAP